MAQRWLLSPSGAVSLVDVEKMASVTMRGDGGAHRSVGVRGSDPRLLGEGFNCACHDGRAHPARSLPRVVPVRERPAGAVEARLAPGGNRTAGRQRRVLVAGVGYGNLCDLSVGPAVAARLRRHRWPAGVYVADLSVGAVLALHWLQQQPAFDAAVFVTAAVRGDAPGTVRRFDWRAPAARAEDVQARVADAVTGVIDLYGMLTVLGYFSALPRRVRVVEVEPRDQTWGPDLSAPVMRCLDRLETLVREEVEVLLA